MTEGKVRKWVRMFEDGRGNVRDEPRSGRLAVITDDLVSAVDQKLHEVRRLTITTLSMEFPQVSALYIIVYENLNFK